MKKIFCNIVFTFFIFASFGQTLLEQAVTDFEKSMSEKIKVAQKDFVDDPNSPAFVQAFIIDLQAAVMDAANEQITIIIELPEPDIKEDKDIRITSTQENLKLNIEEEESELYKDFLLIAMDEVLDKDDKISKLAKWSEAKLIELGKDKLFGFDWTKAGTKKDKATKLYNKWAGL